MRSALILETHNLKHGLEQEDAVRSLARLLAHLQKHTPRLAALHELIVTCTEVDDAVRLELEDAAGRAITFVQTLAGDDYYDAKNRGFEASESELVVFADSDCWPDPGWLGKMLQPFDNDHVQAVAGRTTYRDTRFGRAATAIDFLYFREGEHGRYTRNFYANNVAFRRETFPGYARAADIYRGPCQQLGMRLHEAGVPIVYAHDARTIHRFPDTRRELMKLRLLRGNDAAAFATEIVHHVGVPVIDKSKLLSTTAVLSGRAFYSLKETKGSLRESAMMLGIHALDCAGAAHRLARGPRLVHKEALSYYEASL